MSKNILIVGATSAIAKEIAKNFIKENNKLFLVARHQEKLAALTNELHMINSNASIDTFILDLNNHQQHATMLDEAYKFFGENVDIALIAHGTLSNQQACEENVDLTLHELNTNLLSTISILTLLANKLELQKKGCIAVITSVAGDRGKRSNYVYSTAKGGLDIFLQGLRNRLYFSNIAVITIKPGFVTTPMTEQFKKNSLWATPERVGKDIYRAIIQRRNIVYTPWWWRFIMLIIKLMPEGLFKRMRW